MNESIFLGASIKLYAIGHAKVTSLTDGFSLWLRIIGLGFLSLLLFIFIFLSEKTESSFPVPFSILSFLWPVISVGTNES